MTPKFELSRFTPARKDGNFKGFFSVTVNVPFEEGDEGNPEYNRLGFYGMKLFDGKNGFYVAEASDPYEDDAGETKYSKRYDVPDHWKQSILSIAKEAWQETGGSAASAQVADEVEDDEESPW